jgi:hypothetical protein
VSNNADDELDRMREEDEAKVFASLKKVMDALSYVEREAQMRIIRTVESFYGLDA